MPRTQSPLYVGTGSFVAALDPATGEEVWRAKLPHIGSTPVTLVLKSPQLYVGSAGRVYCLDKRDGSLLWENGLKRMGWGTVLLAMEGADAASSQDGLTSAWHRQWQQAAAAGAAGACAAT